MKKELIDNTWTRYQCDNCLEEEAKPCVLFIPIDTPMPVKYCPFSKCIPTNWQKVD